MDTPVVAHKLRYIACGIPYGDDARKALWASELFKHGDARLVWVNEGDLCMVGECLDKRPGTDAEKIQALRTALAHCLGLLCESGDLNNYRNLSDAELGKAWTETAKEAASILDATA